jgi:signal transduction histidine kinase
MNSTLRWLPRSLVGRVYALYTATLVAFVAAGLALFYYHQFTVELEEAQLRAESLSAVIVPTVSDSAVIGDYDTIRRTLERAVDHSSFSSASFIDLRGGVVRAPRDDPPDVIPPRWLLASVASRLYDTNHAISVGGHDYGVLRISFSAERIAGQLWAQTRLALVLAGASVIGGLILIRFPLVRWLGNLNRIPAFEQAMHRGLAAPEMLVADEAPTEFRETFEVLSRAAVTLQAQRTQAAVTLVALRRVLEGLTHEAPAAAAGIDDLAAISMMISELVTQLQVRGEQLDAIFALSPDGFVSFDSQRRANYVSPAFTRLTGIPEAQVLGVEERQIEAMLHALSDSDGKLPWCGFEAMRRDLRKRDDGAPPRRELIELASPVKRVLEAGLREGTTDAISQVLSLRDITHETEVDQMKSEFLSTAAHELRTPMASIYGFSELMMRRKLPPEQQIEVVATIHRQTELMIAIVNELLDLARIEARRGKDFEFETIDLAALVPELLREFKPPREREDPLLDIAAAPLLVRVDRNKMRQAIGNVLSNAYKYSPQGGAVHVCIVRNDTCIPSMIGIEVRDHGIGMAPAQLARVSERFYRADASGNIPGTGLGMSIVKEIIELLGGRLTLASELGHGTAVTLWLPPAPSV